MVQEDPGVLDRAQATSAWRIDVVVLYLPPLLLARSYGGPVRAAVSVEVVFGGKVAERDNLGVAFVNSGLGSCDPNNGAY